MNPKHIVCAVRGQPHSRAAVTRAIDLALEHGVRLTFVHVMDAEFLAHATVGIPRLMMRELRSVWEFLMQMLRDRAERRGIPQAETVLLEGRVAEELPRFLQARGADVLVLGGPAGFGNPNAFSPVDFEAFVKRIEVLGVQVVVVPAA